MPVMNHFILYRNQIVIGYELMIRFIGSVITALLIFLVCRS